MFDEPERVAERLPADVVDRRQVVEQVRVRDTLQHRLAQVFEDDLPLADAQRRHLLVVADDDHLLAEVERNQRIEVGLAGLVDDHDVEARRCAGQSSRP
jgi:uncharacterized protein YjiK